MKNVASPPRISRGMVDPRWLILKYRSIGFRGARGGVPVTAASCAIAVLPRIIWAGSAGRADLVRLP
ncbi:hypothetical protein Asera_03830 [Actinocatenispora sera]|uniref:Uncharacterized protein n=1 Tax=Actinocatenispora sera TaxID=390989 RepID=A0A810KUD4_9ACTN|nr:hypothetical protein Asera_03830 [Actinocatenispora sera]